MNKLMRLLAALSLALVPAAASATRITPMVVNLTPAGRTSTARVELTNSETRDLPIEVLMFAGEISERGELTLTPADDRFLVFPPQAVVPAQRQQMFRIQYLPDQPITQSQVYYMSVRQIPVDLDPGVNRIQVVMTFNVLVNVAADGAVAAPAVTAAAPAEVGGAHGVEVRIANTGNGSFQASNVSWTIAGTDEAGTAFSVTRTPSEMSQLLGYGLVAPGRARIFFVPTDRKLVGPVTVTVRN